MNKTMKVMMELAYLLVVIVTPSIFLIFPDLVFIICTLSLLILLEYFFLAVLVRSLKWNLVIVFSSWLLLFLVNSIERYLHLGDLRGVFYGYIADYILIEIFALMTIHVALQAGLVFAVRYSKIKKVSGAVEIISDPKH